MRGKALPVAMLLLLLGLAACVIGWFAIGRKHAPMSPPYRFFYGRVVDQEGQPISGAQIIVQLSRMAENPLYPGGTLPDRLPQNRLSVYSDTTGTFQISIPPPNHAVEIMDVRAPGYTWLIDWAWTVSLNKPQAGENRFFVMPPTPDRQYATYIPDAQNPAVFVLVENGYARPLTTMPPRGGSDRGRDGRVARNGPHPVAVPSTGPGAPQGNDAISARIGEYLEQRNAHATTQPHD
jgi:hypothetical protein